MSKQFDFSQFDDAFKLTYNLISNHIAKGDATTADLPACFAGILKVIRAEIELKDQKHQPEHRK